ncbi:hypothetical protein BH11PSE3_BH11PSE3_48490 [soil metagenome]
MAHNHLAEGGHDAHNTILVVEDDGLLRDVTVDYLEDVGLPVLQAETAEDAIEILKDHGEIGAVFSDVQMPGRLDGIGLARWIARERPDVKVLLTSGRVSREDAREWPLLAKPYNMDDVERRLRAFIG